MSFNSTKIPTQPIPFNEWECFKCTFINDPSNKTCSICDFEYVEPLAKIATQPKEFSRNSNIWTCHQCTFAANPDRAKTCEVCDHERNGMQRDMTSTMNTSIGCKSEKAISTQTVNFFFILFR